MFEPGWLQFSLVNGYDLDSYVEEQGPGAALTVEAVREFEVLVAMAAKKASKVSASLDALTRLVI